MNTRIQELVEKLHLKAHPEGGYYSETYRSDLEAAGAERSLATCTYFLMTSDNVSKFHSIAGDEIWFYHEGSPLTVHILSEKGYEKLLVGPLDHQGHRPQQLVPPGVIFGSTVEQPDSYSLVSCMVAPGFDFRDFRLYSADELLAKWPEAKEIIGRLT
ncbi:cupin domain-containing protein [Cognataquiflexum rubidum]|uniref:cupin domain-containing protein n=1 Tax=Cognataquiflexum rubidum TaxID=2922273 RepID=UPI001F12A1D3|nr:cupin domain-containing protein [Cognataquiflexum rubidum]MCH6232390.1 cupin domain-containing protein [Cognataquiflexum rubidum]